MLSTTNFQPPIEFIIFNESQIMKYLNLVTIISFLFLTGCAEPLSEDKLDYVGLWRGGNELIEITEDGSVSYAKVRLNNTETIEGPIKEFTDEGFVVGYLFLTKKFKVDKPPYQEDGKWKMVLNGVEMTKANF